MNRPWRVEGREFATHTSKLMDLDRKVLDR